MIQVYVVFLLLPCSTNKVITSYTLKYVFLTSESVLNKIIFIDYFIFIFLIILAVNIDITFDFSTKLRYILIQFKFKNTLFDISK